MVDGKDISIGAKPILIENMKNRIASLTASPVFILYLTNLLLVHPIFLPEMHDLGLWDEAAFISTGRIAFSSGLPAFSANPLMYLLFGIPYLFVARSPFWMVHLASIVRFLSFTLIWWGTYLVASRLRRHAHPLVVMGMFLVLPFSLGFLTFPSDPVFAGFAALSLWALLGYFEKEEHRDLVWASIFMSLAAFARNDGLVLFVILLALAAMLSWRKPRFVRAMTAVAVPFVVMVFGYVGLRGLITGDFALGTVERTYENFESGHEVLLTSDEGIGGTIEARLEARQVYGTPEENHYSVFRAIMNAPDVYWQRLRIVLLDLPFRLLDIYGKQFASVLFLLALWGIYDLWSKRAYKLLTIMILWPAHLVTGAVITIFRTGHLMFPFYVLLALAAIGLTSLVENWHKAGTRSLWTLVLGVLTLYGMLDNKLAITYNATLVLAAFWIGYWLRQWKAKQEQDALVVGWMVLLVAGVVLRGGFPGFKIRTLGDDPREQAVLALYEHLDEGDVVAAREPGLVLAAEMTPLTLASTSVPLDLPPDEFMGWLRDQGVVAVYADHIFASSPAIWEKIQPHIGTQLERVFIADGGDIQLLMLVDAPDNP